MKSRILKRYLKPTTLILMMVMLFSAGLQAQNTDEGYSDEQVVQEVIRSAYIEGIHNLGDIEAIRKGFHPGFNLLIKNRQGQLSKLPIYTWIEIVESKKAQSPKGPEKLTTVEFVDLDITGDAAMAKINLFRDGRKIYTDYLFLYKFGDDWRIVSKIYESF